MFEDIFRRKKVNKYKLARYGFEANGGCWICYTTIMEGNFSLRVSVSENGEVDTDLIENETNEPYTLYKTNASGTFVGDVRAGIENILGEIADECFTLSVFKSQQTLDIIDYVLDTYGDEPEFLWTKFPDNAVWRRKDNKKAGIQLFWIIPYPQRKFAAE